MNRNSKKNISDEQHKENLCVFLVKLRNLNRLMTNAFSFISYSSYCDTHTQIGWSLSLYFVLFYIKLKPNYIRMLTIGGKSSHSAHTLPQKECRRTLWRLLNYMWFFSCDNNYLFTQSQFIDLSTFCSVAIYYCCSLSIRVNIHHQC